MTKPFSTLKVAIIGIPGKWSTEVLADAIEAQTGFRWVIDIEKVVADLSKPTVSYEGKCLCELDGIIIKKISQTYSPLVLDRLEILRFIEKCGVQIFSKPEEIIKLVDRMSCTVGLSKGNIPMPPTTITEDLEAALGAIQTYGEAVFKPLFSTKARGMMVMSAKTAKSKLREQLQTFYSENKFFYIQKKLDLPGQDLGLIFLNGQYRGAYARVGATGNWNTTIDGGGKYMAATPSAEMIEIAQRAQAQFNLSFTTVDMAETADGPVCFEVSAFGGFRGAKDGLGLDMASEYALYVLETLSQNPQKENPC
ncbi:MAG: GAK system ATP-grasp enzyme [Thiotrichales bacterium]|nr:GAK system ATP-grasp enzyme [Thiotrichales bacterium]